MLEIITRTPIWVFVLFFVLIIIGLLQLKDRNISLQRVAILPVMMVFLSFYGVISVFGLNIKTSLLWLIGLIIATLLNLSLNLPRNSIYDKELKTFFIKGSSIPFILIMIIFFIKYFVGVIVSRQLPILNEIYFIYGISFIYGILSGFFLGRILVLLKLRK